MIDWPLSRAPCQNSLVSPLALLVESYSDDGWENHLLLQTIWPAHGCWQVEWWAEKQSHLLSIRSVSNKNVKPETNQGNAALLRMFLCGLTWGTRNGNTTLLFTAITWRRPSSAYSDREGSSWKTSRQLHENKFLTEHHVPSKVLRKLRICWNSRKSNSSVCNWLTVLESSTSQETDKLPFSWAGLAKCHPKL